eukprot:gene8215-9094_t
MKIGVIACEDGLHWGGERGITNYIISKLQEANAEFGECEMIPIHAVTGQLPGKEDIDGYDGFIISGSHHSVNDNQEWIRKLLDFVQLVFKNERSRLFGICFGHQLIAKAMHGKVEDNPSKKFVWGTEKISADQILVDKTYYKQSLGAGRDDFMIMQSHGECVSVLPANAVCVGRSATCQSEILMYGDKALSLQGHPELVREEMMTKLLPRLKNAKILSEQEAKYGVESLNEKDQLKLMHFVRAFLCR